MFAFYPVVQTKLITGETEDSGMLDAFVPEYDILCCTPQILVNNLNNEKIASLSRFSLLIFDEYHNTRGDEPYARLGRRYLVEKASGQKNLPQVIE